MKKTGKEGGCLWHLAGGLAYCLLLLGDEVIGLSETMEYKRYPAYPEYCSIPEQMSARSVSPPGWDESEVKTELVQVTSVIRHGARTPWSSDMRCWDGYWQDSETGVWDCELTSLISPPSAPFVKEVEVNPDIIDVAPEEERERGDGAMFLFEKRYDALKYPPQLSNSMNGTCQVGQLLLRGYDQEIMNGKHLRNAYVFDGNDNNSASDPRLRLFDLTQTEADSDAPSPFEEPNVRYRADDEQRTLMSGQVLLRSLFGDLIAKYSQTKGQDPVIVLHTADYQRDVVGLNGGICPRLSDLGNQARESDEFKAFNNSNEANLLRRMMATTLGADFTNNVIDCLMTTICTDRPLPPILDDFRRNAGENNRKRSLQGEESDSDSQDGSLDDENFGPDIFERLLNFTVYRANFGLLYNNSAFSKLAMGPLWHEIMSNILPIVNTDNRGDPTPPPKLALISGHDSTIQPLLATLGPNVWDGKQWTPYASMLIIEIHRVLEVIDDSKTDYFKSEFAFRILYNGEPITGRMDGCQSGEDLCDISGLLNQILPYATVDRECDSISTESQETEGQDGDVTNALIDETKVLLATPGGSVVVILLVFISAMLGSLFTFIYLTRRLPCYGSGARYSRGTNAFPIDQDSDWNFNDSERDHANGGSNGNEQNNGRHTKAVDDDDGLL